MFYVSCMFYIQICGYVHVENTLIPSKNLNILGNFLHKNSIDIRLEV